MTQPSWIGYEFGGRYRVDGELGHGGMSAVYRATDATLTRVVAIKLIHSHLSRDAEFVRRFRAEANVLAKLRHPHIVQVFDLNQEGDTFYLVLEFVPGETLQARLKRLSEANRQMPVSEVFKIALEVGDAMQYAHERDIIHRDIKPANVMLNVHGDAILTDFGIVKIVGGTQHTATGAVLGTARYMSPEQIRGHRIDATSDIYSFGVMLYEMLGGRPPFNSDSAMSLMMMHINEPVPDVRQLRPEVPPGLVAIINKAMSKEVGQRYQSMAQLLADLRQVQAGGRPAATAQARPAAAKPAPRDMGLTELMESEMEPAAPAPRPRPAAVPAPAPTPARMSPGEIVSPQKESQRTLYIASVVAVLAVIAGLFLIFGSLGGDDDGGTSEEPGGGASSPAATAVVGLQPTGEGTTPLPAVDTPEAEATATDPATPTSPAPTATNTPPPTATNPPPPTATNPPPATATNPPPPTAAIPPSPTATIPPSPTTPPVAQQFAVRITGITVDNNRYVVSYETSGYTEALPGRHIHFFFNTVPPDQAGVPGSGPWILYGGPRPFTGYSVSDRPGAASQMCALVANDDHSVIANSGNCWNLP